MFDDRLCPACQTLLKPGTRTCVKCGRTVEPAKTNLEFIDWPSKLYPWLVHHLGPIWAPIVAAAVGLILFVLFIGAFLLKFVAAHGGGPWK